MGRMVKRLSNLEIDEVSLVDRPANQHGTIAISKADSQEDNMPEIYDAEGNEVFEDELQVGDYVYDDQGNEFQVVEGDELGDDDLGQEEYEEEFEPEREPELVGKAGNLANLVRRGGQAAERGGQYVRNRKIAGGMAFRGAASAAPSARGVAARGRDVAGRAGERAGQAARGGAIAAGSQGRAVGAHVGRNKFAYGGGTLLATTGGSSYYGSRRGSASKSLGDQVLEELSKAYTDDDRDQVIAKALNQVGEVAKRNGELEQAIDYLIEERDAGMFREVAKSYDLPGAEEDIAGLLQRASLALPEQDVAMLDRFFTQAGEIQKSYFEEVGYTGGRASNTLDEVYAMAGEVVAKNADMGLTTEQAVTAMFSANPDAYDAYEAESRTRD